MRFSVQILSAKRHFSQFHFVLFVSSVWCSKGKEAEIFFFWHSEISKTKKKNVARMSGWLPFFSAHQTNMKQLLWGIWFSFFIIFRLPTDRINSSNRGKIIFMSLCQSIAIEADGISFFFIRIKLILHGHGCSERKKKQPLDHKIRDCVGWHRQKDDFACGNS